MTAPWMLLLAIAGTALVYVLAPIVASVFVQYREPRLVRCPETDLIAGVQIDARHAALTAIPGPPHVRVADCSCWPERAGCAQRCVAPAV